MKSRDTVLGAILVSVVAAGIAAFTWASADLLDTDSAGPAPEIVTVMAMSNPRVDHTAVLLEDGSVLVQGGGDGETISYITAEIYDPATGTWSKGPLLNSARRDHRSIALQDGRVLSTGGLDHFGVTFTAEALDLITGEIDSRLGMRTQRALHTLTMMPDGYVLVIGGFSGTRPLRFTDLYNPETGRF